MSKLSNEQIEFLIAAGENLADTLYWFIKERDRPDSGIKSIPRIGMELHLEEWEYARDEIKKLIAKDG